MVAAAGAGSSPILTLSFQSSVRMGVLVFGSKLVSCDAAGLPFGMVSEPRRRLEATPAGSLVEYLAVKMYFRVSAEFLELC